MPKQQGLLLAKRELNPKLENLARARSRLGEFDWHELVPDVALLVRKLSDDDSPAALDAFYEIARIITADFFHNHVPKIPEDQSQLSMFYDPDAYLTLGGGQRIRMADAKADHLERSFDVETGNFESQSNAFFFKARYYRDRIPQLRERDCTLADIEAA